MGGNRSPYCPKEKQAVSTHHFPSLIIIPSQHVISITPITNHHAAIQPPVTSITPAPIIDNHITSAAPSLSLSHPPPPPAPCVNLFHSLNNITTILIYRHLSPLIITSHLHYYLYRMYRKLQTSNQSYLLPPNKPGVDMVRGQKYWQEQR